MDILETLKCVSEKEVCFKFSTFCATKAGQAKPGCWATKSARSSYLVNKDAEKCAEHASDSARFAARAGVKKEDIDNYLKQLLAS